MYITILHAQTPIIPTLEEVTELFTIMFNKWHIHEGI